MEVVERYTEPLFGTTRRCFQFQQNGRSFTVTSGLMRDFAKHSRVYHDGGFIGVLGIYEEVIEFDVSFGRCCGSAIGLPIAA